jgi:hypothetical protein
VKEYGGCAVYGCESREAREVSAIGWLTRVARLFLTAIVLPPRVVRRLRQGPTAEESEPPRPGRWMRAFLVGAGGVSTFLVLSKILSGLGSNMTTREPVPLGEALLSLVLGPILLLAAPFLMMALVLFVTLLPTLAYALLGRLSQLMKAEFAALARADEHEQALLGRLRGPSEAPLSKDLIDTHGIPEGVPRPLALTVDATEPNEDLGERQDT